MSDDKRLTTLISFCRLLCDSVNVEGVGTTAAEMIAVSMNVEIVLLYSLEDKSGELVLLAYRGVPLEFAKAVDKMKLGEGFNGRVAETGEAMLVTNAAQDPRSSRSVVEQAKISSQIIVPMKSKGRVVGTICAATRQRRQFLPE